MRAGLSPPPAFCCLFTPALPLPALLTMWCSGPALWSRLSCGPHLPAWLPWSQSRVGGLKAS